MENIQPTEIGSEPDTEVVGLMDNEYAELIVTSASEVIPKTPFDEIVTRGGNNPDGKFILPE
jgi:hypothetical protein